jgi:hypothetical protein
VCGLTYEANSCGTQKEKDIICLSYFKNHKEV